VGGGVEREELRSTAPLRNPGDIPHRWGTTDGDRHRFSKIG